VRGDLGSWRSVAALMVYWRGFAGAARRLDDTLGGGRMPADAGRDGMQNAIALQRTRGFWSARLSGEFVMPVLQVSQVETRSILTPTGGFLAGGYTHTLNPAFGCAYGRGFCGQFCYARAGMAHRFHADGREWGEYLAVKSNAAELLRMELDRAAARPREHKHHIERLRIFASSSTDPCAGAVLPVFEACLRELASRPIAKIVIQTRAPAVLRLRDLIARLGDRAVLSFTIETDSDEVWSAGPRGAPSITQRRATIERLRECGVPVHLALSPLLPLRDAAEFAEWIATHCDYATVDTFSAGDGSGGVRTAALPLPAIYASQGWNWRDDNAARSFFAMLKEKMGDRAGWSCDGFARLGWLRSE